ncbi:MAG TPA: methyltransferase domain-containing protein [Candidatus Koribacter sp.]|jgi:ubiquinone/menaquinone biosynthesis C-methylase UbiE
MSSPHLVAAPISTAAFDKIAEHYDEVFTESLIGRAQRNAVWQVMDRVFHAGERVLELNCGTGEDALHLAEHEVAVVACDISPRMIEVARRKLEQQSSSPVSFHVLSTERISELAFRGPFDGVFSNFGGLNCVSDLRDVADQLAHLVRPGGSLLLCLCSRYCLWEMLLFAFRGHWTKAMRRARGRDRAQIDGIGVDVHYPTAREMKQIFGPWFQLEHIIAIGFAIPPSYMEGWAHRHPSAFRTLERVDARLRNWPGLRVLGDHILVVFRRCGE